MESMPSQPCGRVNIFTSSVLIGGSAAVNNQKRSASFMDKEAGCNLAEEC
jgi:hypothetical protein